MKRLTICLALAASSAFGATWDDLKANCSTFKENYKGCLTDLFTARPAKIAVKSIVPGGGFGVGGAFSKDFNRGMWQRKFDASAAVSLRQFWVAEMKVSMEHPKFGVSNSARDNFNTHVYAVTKTLPQMAYYGIGPNTSRDNIIDYRERFTITGVDAYNPFSKWFGVGGRVEGIFVDVSLLTNPQLDSSIQRATRASIPGAVPATFIRYGGYLNPRAPGGRFDFDSKFGYDFYQDTNAKEHFSFGRMTGDVTQKIFPFGLQQFRRDRFITIRGRYSSSLYNSRTVIPFYMQETIGGSTLDSDFTLRGFQDYRFRAPHVMFIQTQYDHRIWEMLGVFAFYDVGKVAISRSNLDFTDMRHSFGVGVNLFLGSNVWFRMAIGLGSGEGRHPYFGVPKF
ncbi:MAG: hypothetical protein ABI995_07595 [Acidobacteriota bacterium]